MQCHLDIPILLLTGQQQKADEQGDLDFSTIT
jgi:hypothetical protein